MATSGWARTGNSNLKEAAGNKIYDLAGAASTNLDFPAVGGKIILPQATRGWSKW